MQTTSKHLNNGILAVSTVAFLATTLIFPLSASAATTTNTKEKTTVTKAVLNTNKDQCIVNVTALNATSFDTVKSWGGEKFNNRQKLLKKYVDKAEKKAKAAEVSKQKKDETTKKQAEKKKLVASAASKDSHSIKLKGVDAEARTTLGQVDDLNKKFNVAKDVKTAADPLCSVIYDQKVYAYLNNKILQTARIDTLNNSLHASKTRLENDLKIEQAGAKNPTTIKNIQDAQKTNAELIKSVEAAETKLADIKKDKLPATDDKGHVTKSAETFNAIWGANGAKDYEALKKKTQAHAAAVNKLYSQVKTKPATKKKTTKKSNSSGQSNGTGGVSAP